MHMLNAPNLDNIGACASNICAHGVQKVCKVNNVRLFCGILDYCQALCLNSGKHEIDRCADGNHIEIDQTAREVGSFNIDHCVFLERNG